MVCGLFAILQPQGEKHIIGLSIMKGTSFFDFHTSRAMPSITNSHPPPYKEPGGPM